MAEIVEFETFAPLTAAGYNINSATNWLERQ